MQDVKGMWYTEQMRGIEREHERAEKCAKQQRIEDTGPDVSI